MKRVIKWIAIIIAILIVVALALPFLIFTLALIRPLDGGR